MGCFYLIVASEELLCCQVRPSYLLFFQQHLNNLMQIALQLIKRLRLRVCAGETRHVANVQTSIRAFFHNWWAKQDSNL